LWYGNGLSDKVKYRECDKMSGCWIINRDFTRWAKLAEPPKPTYILCIKYCYIYGDDNDITYVAVMMILRIWQWLWYYIYGDDITYMAMMILRIWRWWYYICGDITYMAVMILHIWRWWYYIYGDDDDITYQILSFINGYLITNKGNTFVLKGHAVALWLRHCATNQKVAGSISGFGGLGVCVLASGTQDCGFTPDRSRRIFHNGKTHSTQSFSLSSNTRTIPD
jgi:hypothetical protein